MIANFEIEDNYAVQLDGIHIDLHNNFLFDRISEFGSTVRVELKNQMENGFPIVNLKS